MTEAPAFASPTGKGDPSTLQALTSCTLRSRGKGKGYPEGFGQAAPPTFINQRVTSISEEGRNPMELTVVQTAHLAQAPGQCPALRAQVDLMPLDPTTRDSLRAGTLLPDPAASPAPGPAASPRLPTSTDFFQRETNFALPWIRVPAAPMHKSLHKHIHTAYLPIPSPLPGRSSGPGRANSTAADPTRPKFQLHQELGLPSSTTPNDQHGEAGSPSTKPGRPKSVKGRMGF